MWRMALVALCLSGCATASRMNRVSLGLTKSEVVAKMGTPASTAAKDNTEYLIYMLAPRGGAYARETYPYFVRLRGGKVDAYGLQGDFDSSRPVESKTTIDLNMDKQN